MPINDIIKKITDAHTGLTTYNMGLVQAKAYRILQQRTNAILEPHNITAIDWALLGLLHEAGSKGLRFAEVADSLGVEPPFVTSLVDGLKNKKHIDLVGLDADRRVKILVITAEGNKFVNKTEKMLRVKMRYLMKGIDIKDILTYRRVLLGIAKNDTE